MAVASLNFVQNDRNSLDKRAAVCYNVKKDTGRLTDMKRMLAILLLAAMLLSAIACGKSEDSGAATTTATPNAPAEVETTTAAVEETTLPPETGFSETIPEEEVAALGLDGCTVNVFMRAEGVVWDNQDIWVETATGDVFNDAVFNRNLFLEEKYGFTFKLYRSADTYARELKNYVLAQDDTYDLAFPMARTAATFAPAGYLVDLYELNYIDPSTDVWNHVFNDEMVYDGKLFFITGDISVNAFKAVRVMMFNKTLYKEYSLESPYELVNSGKWTFDKMNEQVSVGSRDLNGDQKMALDDQWGMVMQTATAGLPLFYGAGLKTVEMVDGLPEITLDSSHASDVFDKITNIFADESVYYIGEAADAKLIFSEGRALLYAEVLKTAIDLRSSEVEFGLLPAPKYNEEQEFYRAYADCWCISPAVIPTSAKNPELSAFVLQATSEASTNTTRTAYYDVALTYQQLRDEESREMLDLIFDNFTLDSCDLYQWGGMVESIRKVFARVSSGNLSSILASSKKALEVTMGLTTKQYDKNT